jgi:5-methylcytosine-specific restriction endonuclease McrA
MRKHSAGRRKAEREYKKLRDEMLPGKRCEVCRVVFATQIHHKAGRIGNLLTERSNLLAVCYPCHEKIERNPKWARDMGYSILRNGVKQ